MYLLSEGTSIEKELSLFIFIYSSLSIDLSCLLLSSHLFKDILSKQTNDFILY